jgi:hypothetical protein
MNYEKKYIKYKEKYLNLKNITSVNMIGGLKTCAITEPIIVDYMGYLICGLPKSIKEIFTDITLDHEYERLEVIKTNTGTASNIVELFPKYKKFIFMMITIALIITLVTKKIYLINSYIINYVRNPIDYHMYDYKEFYNELKKNKFVRGEEEIITNKWWKFNENNNSLQVLLREHRLFTIGTKTFDQTKVDRMPSDTDKTLDILLNAISNLIFDFRLSYADIFKYIFDPRLKYFINGNSKKVANTYIISTSIQVYEKIFIMLQKSINFGKENKIIEKDFSSADKKTYIHQSIAEWMKINQEELNKQLANFPCREREIKYFEKISK